MAGFSRQSWLRGVIRSGEPFIWASGAALTLTLLTTVTLVVVVLVNGLGALWPSDLALLTLNDGTKVLGEIVKKEVAHAGAPERIQLKIGNRDLYGLDFKWIPTADIESTTYPSDAVALERWEDGNFYGFLQDLDIADQPPVPADWPSVQRAWRDALAQKKALAPLDDTIYQLNQSMIDIQDKLQEWAYEGVANDSPRVEELKKRDDELRQQSDQAQARQTEQVNALQENKVTLADASGQTVSLPLVDIVRMYRPNDMSVASKSLFYMAKIKELLLDNPRESNTEGGLFPAIFGTVSLVFLMSLVSFPLGVLAGIYLTEYAKEGFMVRAVHIAVNNLAGIPSIVYGIFGLGFFVYGIGGFIDRVFFPERLPSPTFGTGGILWASMTLGILTVPVVIVATEEALSAVPRGVREGSYALGATRLQTLFRTVLPMASPGIMTGLILAMARAAGEVAPLMITGVVKLAPALPIDTQFPYVHLDRKFMHLGFHIYDMGFQSPNAEAAKPMVFVTAFLLVLIVLIMSSVAIYLRKRMRERYALRSL